MNIKEKLILIINNKSVLEWQNEFEQMCQRDLSNLISSAVTFQELILDSVLWTTDDVFVLSNWKY